MKLLFVINNLDMGGAERLIVDLAIYFQQTYSMQVDVYVLESHSTDLHQVLESHNIKVLSSINRKYHLRHFFELRRLIQKGAYDVVHTHLFPAQLYTIVAKRTGFRHITTEHNVYNRRRSFRLLRYFDQLLYSRYDKLISVSDKTEHLLRQWLNEADDQFKDKYQVISNGIDLTKFRHAQAYPKSVLFPNLNEEQDVLLCMISRFAPAKDHQSVIETMRELPSNYKLLFVGSGDSMPSMMELSQQYNLNHRIKFLGNRDDVNRILKTVDIVIQASLWEGQPLTIIEAMASEKPIVASRIEEIESVLAKQGFYFENKNIPSLLEAIQKAAQANRSIHYENIHAYDIKTCAEAYHQSYR
jgi:glycosyltransferase involved in cell wall biosynthesis